MLTGPVRREWANNLTNLPLDLFMKPLFSSLPAGLPGFSWARLIPGCGVSNQMSTAGYEAGGTSNMNFMMNGVLTIDTVTAQRLKWRKRPARRTSSVLRRK